MNDDIERRLRRVRPRGASPELRPRVLAAVAIQLGADAPQPSRLRRRPGLAVAAAVIASLALNYWVNDSLDRRLAIALGPQFSDIRLWVYEPDLAERLKSTRINDIYLPGCEIPAHAVPTHKLAAALDGAESGHRDG